MSAILERAGIRPPGKFERLCALEECSVRFTTNNVRRKYCDIVHQGLGNDRTQDGKRKRHPVTVRLYGYDNQPCGLCWRGERTAPRVSVDWVVAEAVKRLLAHAS